MFIISYLLVYTMYNDTHVISGLIILIEAKAFTLHCSILYLKKLWAQSDTNAHYRYFP